MVRVLEQDRSDNLMTTFFLLGERYLCERSFHTAELPGAEPAKLATVRLLALQRHITQAPHARTRRMLHQQPSILM